MYGSLAYGFLLVYVAWFLVIKHIYVPSEMNSSELSGLGQVCSRLID